MSVQPFDIGDPVVYKVHIKNCTGKATKKKKYVYKIVLGCVHNSLWPVLQVGHTH